MANKLLNVKVDYLEADGGSVVGKIVNVYSSYAYALLHGEDGLADINVATVLTGVIGAAITQEAKVTGVTVDNNGKVMFYADDGEYEELFLMSTMGRQSGPQRIVVA